MRLPERVIEQKIIPVARHLNEKSARDLVDALAAGGIECIEVTVEGTEGMAAISSITGGETVVGAGTVVSVSQAAAARDAGAEFIVSPHLDLDIARWAAESGIPFIPGALTPTEVFNASQCDPAAVKVFPAHVGGPEYVRSLLGPYPDLDLIPTGGVTSENISRFLRAGAVAVGVGGWLTAVAELGEITRRARLLVDLVTRA